MLAEAFPHQPPDTITLMRSPQSFFGNRHPQTRKADAVSGGSGIQTVSVQAFTVLEYPLEVDPAR
jgi:hypothetical protein